MHMLGRRAFLVAVPPCVSSTRWTSRSLALDVLSFFPSENAVFKEFYMVNRLNMPQQGSNTERQPDPTNTSSRGMRPLWDRALERYREELEDSNEDEILAGSRSLDDLIAYAKSIGLDNTSSSRTLNRLGPTLKRVDDFSAGVAICLGANTQLIAFVWGSLRLIITLASSTDDTLQEVVDMLEELSLSLPSFHYHEENLPLDRAFENALVDLYSEVICFYARAIRYFKSNPHLPMQRQGWSNFQKDFTSTVRRVKHYATATETKADLARMRMEEGKYDEVLQMLKSLRDRNDPIRIVKHCHYIPVSLIGHFEGRDAELAITRKALDPEKRPNQLKSLALCGMAGIGKTQLALRYTLDTKRKFDIVLWIAAETSMSLDQSFREAAFNLGLRQESLDSANELTATAQVKNWLSDPTNDQSWLVIFNNADDIGLLRHAWPANGNGSVLLTSRNPNTASTIATQTLRLQPFNESVGAEVLLQLLQIEQPNSDQRHEASKITRILGGLPLALDQVANFMKQRRVRIQDFVDLYGRNAAKIDARRYGLSSYPHTLATVFEMTLANLTGAGLHLQNLLSFLEPDAIPERIFEDGAHLTDDPDFEFLKDEMDFGDAEEQLLEIALVNKNVDEKSLSVHRLVQTAVLRRLDASDKSKYFAVAVDLLSLGFPDTWSKDVGHQKKEWARCERYLPHVNALDNLTKDRPFITNKPDAWAELLLRGSWYLYETEQYAYARSFIRVALENFTNKRSLAYASAVDLQGLIDLDMAAWQEALPSFDQGLAIRQALLPSNDPLIAFALNNLAIAWTEAPDLPKAELFHQQAISIRAENKSDRIGNSYSNYAVTLLRMDKPDKAEQMLMSCPSLKNCTEETFLEADNPRYVGDMVLLSRIRKAQGRGEDALRLASKALAWRQKVHRDRFKTCDSMYDVACLLCDQGQIETSLEMLHELSCIAETLDLGENHAARAEWKVSRILKAMGKATESAQHEQRAEVFKKACRFDVNDMAGLDDQSWERLTPYMLW